MENSVKTSNLKIFKKDDQKLIKELIKFQKSELIDHIFYKKIAEEIKDEEIKKILLKLSKEELGHYEIFKKITKTQVELNFFDKLKIWFYEILLYLFGVAFVIKLAERNETENIKKYLDLDLNE